MEDLQRVKELLSHKMPGASWADLIGFITSDYRKRKDPLIPKEVKKTESVQEQTTEAHSQVNPINDRTDHDGDNNSKNCSLQLNMECHLGESTSYNEVKSPIIKRKAIKAS